jgi:hypothetical protein
MAWHCVRRAVAASLGALTRLGGRLAVAVALLSTAAVVDPAHAREEPRRIVPGAGEQRTPSDYDRPPPGWRLSPDEVLRIAAGVPQVGRSRAGRPEAYARAYLKPRRHWQVSVFLPPDDARGRSREVAQVLIRDSDGRVLETWTGFRVAWTMARGYPGAFGRTANAPWIWLPLCALFLLPFLRLPLRLLHLDLLVLLAFSISYARFTAGDVEASVPLAYPPLAYLLIRMLVLAGRRARGRDPSERPPLALTLPTGALTLGVVFLLAFRVALNVTTSTVIDVGYAGVIGADRLTQGVPLYGFFPADNPRGDTYGPVAYYAYVPWELLLPWSGAWDHLPAAHAAAIFFDLATAAGLWLLGRAVRGPRLGVLLAYLWCAFPFTLLTLNTNANDALPAALLVLVLLALGRPWARGAALAMAGLSKFAPLILGPLIATYRGGSTPGAWTRSRANGGTMPAALATTAAFAVTVALVLLPVAGGGGLERFWSRTVAFQADRDSPFSLWGLYDGLAPLQPIAAFGAVALALVAAVVPRRRDVVVVAALGAAVLIALQIALEHWFYTYLLWWLPLVWLALLAPFGEPAPPESRSGLTPARPAAPGRSRRPVGAARRGSGPR